MKILDSTVINGVMQKFVETADGYIVNGHYYDKGTLVVKPFVTIPTLSSQFDLSMSKKLTLNTAFAVHNRTQGDTVVIDRYDPTITYVFTIDYRNNNHRAIKLRENNGAVSVLNTIAYGALPTTYPYTRAYCGQDSLYVYYIMSTSGWHEYFVKMDKTSLTLTVVEDLAANSYATFIKETTTHIYYSRKTAAGAITTIKRYNKTTAAIETLTTIAKTSALAFTSCLTDPLTVSDSEMYTFTVFHNTSTNKYGITRYKMDTTQSTLGNILTEADMTITWNAAVTQLPVFAANYNVHYDPFITTTTDGKQYLNIAVYEPQISSTAANLTSYGIYTFLIDMTNNALTFKSFLAPSSDYFRGFIGIRNNNFLIGATTNQTLFMNFDTVNETFKVSDSLSNIPYHVGIDQSENIFVVNSLSEVEYLNPFVPTNVTLKSELASYSYQGIDIPTYCTINCQNYSGTYIAANIQLTIKGPAVFSANGTKTVTVSTLTTGDLQVPMKVQGGSPVTVQGTYLM
jgi:hypothetical protein